MTAIVMKPEASSARARTGASLEFQLIFAIALLLFAIAAVVQLFVPRAWRAGPTEQPFFQGVISAARSATKFTFMG